MLAEEGTCEKLSSVRSCCAPSPLRTKALEQRSNNVAFGRVPLDRAALAQRGNSHLASYGRVVAQLERTIGLFAGAHAVEEIPHVSRSLVFIAANDIWLATNRCRSRRVLRGAVLRP